MGWVILLALLGLGISALWLFRVRGGLLMASAAAMLVGAAGYAFQGNPDLGGSPAQASEARGVLPLSDARQAFFGSFSPAESCPPLPRRSAAVDRTRQCVG